MRYTLCAHCRPTKYWQILSVHNGTAEAVTDPASLGQHFVYPIVATHLQIALIGENRVHHSQPSSHLDGYGTC
jgi:hypothetical protein